MNTATATTAATETRSVVVERDMPFPPERIWRALTQPHLIAEWLMKNDFQPAVGHQFTLSGDWGSAECKVLTIEPNKTLSYTWTAFGMGTVVHFTLTPAANGTHLRVEQSGFAASAERAYIGAQYGWQKFIGNLEQVVARPG
jgi:uncharacterized protein YndB with AHSA1/START domain